MTYRDDHEAALQRADALERENAELRARLDQRAIVPAPRVAVERPRHRVFQVILSAVLWIVAGAAYWFLYR